MRKFQNIFWLLLVVVAALWIAPASVQAAPAFVTSGAHSVPVSHWLGWLAGALGSIAVGAVAIEGAESLEMEIKQIKNDILTAIKGKADAETVRNMQTQLDALDVKLAERHAGGAPEESLEKIVRGSDSVARLMQEKRGAAVIDVPTRLLQRKTAVLASSAGFATTGVLQLDHDSGIVAEARPELLLRNVISSRPTTLGYVDFIKVSSPMVKASPQIESHDKLENAVSFTAVSEKVRVLATTIPASRQILDDMPELIGFLQSSLAYYVDLAAEIQMLSGSGSGEDLHGLITQATSFDTSLLPANSAFTRSDVIACAIEQLGIANEVPPTFVVLNPRDAWAIRRTKDSLGRYLTNDPFWGLLPIVTTNIASGTFLVGSGRPEAAEIRDRMATIVEIGTVNNQFAQNMITLRAESRLCLCVKRAASFVTGTMTQSPA